MKRDIFYNFICYLSAAVLIYIVILTVFINATEMLNLPSFMIIFFAVLSSFAVLGLYLPLRKTILKNGVVFFVFLTVLTILPRLLWIFVVDTKPVSDFGLYHSYASNASKGVFDAYHYTYPLFAFKFSYPLILSVVYRILGSTSLAGMLFNVAVSMGISLLIYWNGSVVFNRSAGQVSGLLFACWPAQIMYSSVLTSEHLFILLVLAVIAFFYRIKNSLRRFKGCITSSIITGILIAEAHFLRPIAVVLFPVLLAYLFIFIDMDMPLIQSIIRKIKIASMMVLSFLIAFSLISIPLSSLTGVPLWRSSFGFSLLVGTNYESGGAYNIQDESIIKEFNCDFENVHKAAMQRAINRIKTSPVEFIRLIEKKAITVWSNENYGLYWSIVESNKQGYGYETVLNNSLKLQGLSQLYYIIILLFSIAGIILVSRNFIYENTIFLLLFLSIFIIHIFLEAQSRYHYCAVPFLILTAGFFIEQFTGRFFHIFD